jgi:hypothetical protein
MENVRQRHHEIPSFARYLNKVLALTVMILGKQLLGTNDANRLRVVGEYHSFPLQHRPLSWRSRVSGGD